MKTDPERLHREALVADLHCDTMLQMRRGYDISQRHESYHVDIPRLIEGGVNLQAFACCLSVTTDRDKRRSRTDLDLDTLIDQFDRHPDKIAVCRNASEAIQIIESDRIAALLAIENGDAIANDLNNLAHFHARGVRYITLTHFASHDWCISSADNSPAFNGLTDFGRDVVRTMNELGIIVDVSHISVRAFEEVLKVTSRPVIASHSCAHSICPHDRNLTDDEIRALADNGGMVGINFCDNFLSEASWRRTEEYFKNDLNRINELGELITSLDDEAEVQAHYRRLRPFMTGWKEALKGIQASVYTVVDHIEHIIRLVGTDHVGLGSDYDGIFFGPVGLEDCSGLPSITHELLTRGHDESTVRKVLGENFMRVFASACD